MLRGFEANFESSEGSLHATRILVVLSFREPVLALGLTLGDGYTWGVFEDGFRHASLACKRP